MGYFYFLNTLMPGKLGILHSESVIIALKHAQFKCTSIDSILKIRAAYITFVFLFYMTFK
jgi:hypothetical protein